MAPIGPPELADDVVRLEPLSVQHVAPLLCAATIARETYTFNRVPETTDAMLAYVESALSEQSNGSSIPFVTKDAASGRVVGSTRFMNLERWTWPSKSSKEMGTVQLDALEIGSTWLAADVQRTGINTHAKLLMLTHAFERWGVRRVTLKTDARNLRSRRAIERLGARLDGVLRAHMPAFDGAARDTAFYSILKIEWLPARRRLEELAGGGSKP
jgi:N-acetyltransferase